MKKTLVLHNDIRRIPELAAFVEALAAECALEGRVKAGLHLALEEAVSNVMMYAYPAGEKGPVEISAVLEGDRLVFTLVDSGVPFDPTTRPDADITLGVEERPIGGLGIYLVRKLMDEVRYERAGGKNVLTLVKRICGGCAEACFSFSCCWLWRDAPAARRSALPGTCPEDGSAC